MYIWWGSWWGEGEDEIGILSVEAIQFDLTVDC